jgi:hypothetical protein
MEPEAPRLFNNGRESSAAPRNQPTDLRKEGQTVMQSKAEAPSGSPQLDVETGELFHDAPSDFQTDDSHEID